MTDGEDVVHPVKKDLSPIGVTALIPCKNGAGRIRDTVQALLHQPVLRQVVVIDDGSSDDTAIEAFNAGATVVRLEKNVGKAAALKAGIDATPAAEVYLLVDADTGHSAEQAIHLLPPVIHGGADLAIGVLPSADGQAGFGTVKNLAAWGIHRAAHAHVKAPLSGQRAVKADLLRKLADKPGFAPRFGVEVSMTIDALNSGATVVEVDVDMTHQHTGRSLRGFVHRGKQGKDVLRALWYRALPLWMRLIPLATVTAALMVICGVAASSQQTIGGAALPHADKVRVVLVPSAEWSTTNVNQLNGALASVVTGNVKDVFNAVAAGSREKTAVASPDVDVSAQPGQPNATTPTLVVGFTVDGQKAALRPIALEGMGLQGTLLSPSTRQTGLVDITDIAPTVLAMEGKPIPASMTGSALRVSPKLPSPSALSAANQSAKFYNNLEPPLILTYVLIQTASYLIALYVGRKKKELPYAVWFAAAVAAFPLATYLTRWIWGTTDVASVAWAATCIAITGVIVFVAGQAMKGPLGGVQRVFLSTTVFLVADILLGGHLQVSGIFGSSPLLGTRYHGLGNPASELLLLSAVLWCAIHVQQAQHHIDAVWSAASMLLIVTVVIGAPGLGSDVGGLLTIVVTSIGLLSAFALGRLAWKWVIAAGGLAVLAVLIAAIADYQRAPASRTHLGRLMARVVNEGGSPLWDTITRKVDANVLGYGFPWTLGVIALAGFVLVQLLRGRWTFAFPLGSAQRFGFIAAMVGSFIGYAVNDSGIVVLALSAVSIGPYVLVEYRLKRSSQLGAQASEVRIP